MAIILSEKRCVHNLFTHAFGVIHTLLECAGAGDVADMAVGGKLLMKDRNVLVLDEEQILYEAKQYMESISS